ncbi:DUF4326 domain-containing protein [Deinococcus aluminii]|uniref:DUF4326 domain-containing protein n=1 Tax=Deinococcus aluminii TaxID=1656885 RepID=A0ABP9XET4_9DEIO
MLRVANLKTLHLDPGETAIYVGRGRAPAGMEHAQLGNPFRVGAAYAPGEAAAAYLHWLRERCRRDTPQRRMILHLARRLNAGERLVVCCWCSPRPCHAHHIAAAIQGYATKLREKQCP